MIFLTLHSASALNINVVESRLNTLSTTPLNVKSRLHTLNSALLKVVLSATPLKKYLNTLGATSLKIL